MSGFTNAVAIANGKGGVGKTSLSTHTAALAASAGNAVCLIDFDPQGHCGIDLGYKYDPGIDDDGLALYNSVAFGQPLTPVVAIGGRTNLDVVVGGQRTEDLLDLLPTWNRRGVAPQLQLYAALAPLAAHYDLIVIDCPPGYAVLQEMALVACRYAVIPTRSDYASYDGLARVAARIAHARELNPPLAVLGVVLYGINPTAKRVSATARTRIADQLGEDVPVFTSSVRYYEAPHSEAREIGVLVHEYAAMAAAAPRFYEPGGRNVHFAPTATKLAADYSEVAEELFARMLAHNAAPAAERVP